MHLSMHNWMRAEPIETTIRRLAKYGYESIEISGEPYQYDTKEVLGHLKENGIRCWGSITLMVEGRNLVQGSEEGRAKTVQYVKDTVTMVKELEGYEVSIVPGEVGKVNADSTPEAEWQWAVDGLKDIFEHSQKEGIKLAVEPIDRTPANPFPNAIETDPVDITPEQRKFIEDHGSDLLSEEFYSSLVERCA